MTRTTLVFLATLATTAALVFSAAPLAVMPTAKIVLLVLLVGYVAHLTARCAEQPGTAW